MIFEDLEAWKAARKLVNSVYAITRENALSRDFGLSSQLQRAAVSIMTNIAEGFERTHLPEKVQFYNIARASAGEVRSLLYVVSDNYPAAALDLENVRNDTVSVGKLVSGLLASTEKRRGGVTRMLSALLAFLS